MGDKLIWESPEILDFNESKETQLSKVDEFVEFLHSIRFKKLADFVRLNRETFMDNMIANASEGIPRGMKLVKAFKFFVNDEEQAMLPKVQDKASQIIQQTSKLRGRLCFSIHPLDYLTISENTNNWNTCHSMLSSYCAGNLSYMADSSTVICYLKDDEKVQLPHFPKRLLWNNKKWRTLLFLSENNSLIFASKQYPFSSPVVMDKIIELLNTKVYEQYSPWSKFAIEQIPTPYGTIELTDKYLVLNGGLRPIFKEIIQPVGTLNYNDILYGHDIELCYTMKCLQWTGYKPLPYFVDPGVISVGGPIKCLNCGKHNIIPANNNVLCKECDLAIGTAQTRHFKNCSYCGKRIFADDAVQIDDKENYACRTCYEKEKKDNG